MNLNLNPEHALGYRSKSQIARILTETWVAENMYCPRCGCSILNSFPDNRPVADFYCPQCSGEYELKSRSGKSKEKITDGAYETMIERITSNQNPDFLFMRYSRKELRVEDFIFIPKHFFVPDIIEKRKPLAPTARRAGWVGCNIMIGKIPKQGYIPIVKDGVPIDVDKVVANVNKSNLLEMKDVQARGWLFDVLECVNNIATDEFTLQDMYFFEEFLSSKHPKNKNVKPKIRQQLQLLRDRNIISFLGNGKYRKI